MRSEEHDVYVNEGSLVEVWRGEHLSVAQQFGTDWDGPVHSVVHAAVFCPPAEALACARAVGLMARAGVACCGSQGPPQGVGASRVTATAAKVL
jgi:hypothetical protein